MAVDLRHLKVSNIPDNGDPGVVQGPDWNAAHVLTQGPTALLGRTDAAPIGPTIEVQLDPATMQFVGGKLGAIIPASEPPSGPAGGALTGTYPNPTLVGGPLTLYAPLASPLFTGSPRSVTPATADSSILIATTAFVKNQGYAIAANYLPLTGGTLTGDLIISHAGNVQAYVDSSDVGTGRPGFALTKRGTLEGIIQADGTTHGQIYYQSMAAGGVHQFFVNGVAVATMAAGLTSFPGGVSTVGNVTISGTVAGNARGIHFQTTGSDRWIIGPAFDAEGGSNAGSTFQINRYTDAGAFLGTVMSIDRPSGNVAFSGAVNAASDLGGYAVWSNPPAAAQAVFHWNITGFTANAQKWQVLNDRTLRFQATDDVGTVQSEVIMNRDGTMSGNGVAINSQPNSYAIVASDAGKFILHGSAGAVATYTIPANASVPFPVGTQIEFVNASANALTIAITTDNMNLSPGGTAGSRTLAQFGHATALKIATTLWYIWGTGLT